MTERLFVLDGPGFLFRAYHALPFLSTSRGVPSHAVFGMSTMLWKLLREDRPEYFAVAWDAPGPTFREERFAAYKETRAPTPDDLRAQIPYVKKLFEALHLPVLEVPGFEADDVLGTVVERTRELPLDVVLVTSDKDMLQLVSPRVRVFSTSGRGGDRVVFDEAAVKAKWGVEPAQIPDILALMGDSIDNIPGVPGVGEKTAAKLIGQFGSVERLYENLSLVPGKLRETLATHKKQALLSRELATVSTRVPVTVDPEAFRRREPDWDRLRALWTELEFYTLLRQLPAEAAAEVSGGEVPTLADAAALSGYLARVPAGDPLAVEWVGEGGPPDPAITAIGLYHPAAGTALFVCGGPEMAPALPPSADHPAALISGLGGRTLIGHDVKPLAEWWLARGGTLPPHEDTAVVAYLLNPARTNYKLEEVCAELLGQGPGVARPGTRGKWIWDLWAMAPRALDEVGLKSLYEDVERPLVAVLAEMERHGIRVDQARLGEFSRELEVQIERITREIYTLAGEEFNIGSPKQLAHILFEKLKLPPVKRTKTGYSTDADVLEQLAIGHELPARIVEHRTLAKLKSTYADALPTLVNPATGRIHTSFNQLVAATGRLSCLPTGSLINTQRGLVGIERVRPGDLVRTARGPRRVLAHQMTGVKTVVALHLSNGMILRCSPEHRLRSEGRWREARTIEVGDPLYMSFRNGLFGEQIDLKVCPTAAYQTRKSPRMPTTWSVPLAELVGYAMADGHLARSNYNGKPAKLILAFGWHEDDLVRHFAESIRRLFGKEPTYRVTRTCPVLEVSGVDICGLFEQIGAGGRSGVIQVPESLCLAPEAVVAGFLRGYFEGDGTARRALSVRSVSRDMLEGLHHLLNLFGIPSSISDGGPDPRGYAPRHTLFVLGDRSKRAFRDRIGFLSERKSADLASTIARQSIKSAGEVLTLPTPNEILDLRRPLLAAHRGADGRVPQAFSVFLHKFVTGRQTCSLPRAERLVRALETSGATAPIFLGEAVAGQYFEVRVRRIVLEPKVPMYDIAVDGEEYIADGIVVHNSSAPNLQNIPVRTELGRRIRAAFVPEPGWRFVAADYSQIELRILAHVSGEESLIEAFRRGEDIHRRTASEVFGVPLDAVSPEQRDIAKTTNFSVIYGVTAFGLSRGLDITPKQAQEFLDRFFARHPKVKAYLARTVAEGRERGFVTTLLGRRRYLPELRSGNPNLRGFGERMATNAPIQGTAADLVKIAMVRMARELRAHRLSSRMLLQVHDELLFEVPPAETDRLQALATEVMESALALDVPLKVDVKVGEDWAAV
jgi:DNA polymerase I-like protein with 3'-5' exonuclease and polymerase domains/5'-3' exonuclease